MQVTETLNDGLRRGYRMILSAQDLDDKITEYMNEMFAQGHRSWKGEKLVAAVMALESSYSRHGSKGLPRAMRALKGWRSLSPSYSRSPHAWPTSYRRMIWFWKPATKLW